MRVIAGSARGRRLKTLEGMDVRPTTDKVKEAIFSAIQFDLPDAAVLDLFAGSGQMGIEALSRGASKAVFIEKNPKAVECIRQNLKTTHLEEKALVMSCDVISAITRLEGKEYLFDTVFMDPPYYCLWEKQVLTALKDSDLINEDTLIIVEASLETDFSYVDSLGFEIVRNKEYKTNKHVFIKRKK